MTVDRERAAERYQLACRRCGFRWCADYQVHRHDDQGGQSEWFYLHGVPVPSPRTTACPSCGGYRVAAAIVTAGRPRVA